MRETLNMVLFQAPSDVGWVSSRAIKTTTTLG